MSRYAALVITLGLVACSDPTGLDGEWSLSWACESGCEHLPPPPLAQSDRLVVDGTSLNWSYASWLIHDGVPDELGCLAVAAGRDWIPRSREPYTLCWDPASDTATTRIWEIGAAGEVQTKWVLVGSRAD